MSCGWAHSVATADAVRDDWNSVSFLWERCSGLRGLCLLMDHSGSLLPYVSTLRKHTRTTGHAEACRMANSPEGACDKMKIELAGHYSYGRLLKSALPGIAMMVISSVYSIVDGLFVSNYVGLTSFAALNLIWPAVMIVGALGLMVGSGGSALISMTLGQKDLQRANLIFGMLVRLIILMAVLFGIPMFIFMESIARFLGAEGEMVHQAVVYGRICVIGLPGFMLQMAFQSFYMTAEEPGLGTRMSLFCGLTNMVLDALFVAVFKWGIAGAAAASMAACFVGGFFPLIYFSSRKRGPGKLQLNGGPFDKRIIVRTCSNGISEFVGNISFNLVCMCYNLQLMRTVGEGGIAAYSVIMYIGYIYAAVLIGYNLTVGPVAGYNYGAANHSELTSLVRRSVIILVSFGVIMVLVAELMAGPFARIFVGYDEALVEYTAMAQRLYMLSFLIAGINMFTSAWFTALNNGTVSALSSFVRTMVFEMGSVFLLPVLFPDKGIWLAVDLAEVLSFVLSVFLLLHFRKQYGY